MRKVRECFISTCLSLLLVICLTVSGFAEETDPIPTFAGISAIVPEITAEVKGSGYVLGADMVTAKLGTEELEFVDGHVYDKTKDFSRIYILVDLSSSMASDLEKIKEDIVRFLDEMVGENDRIYLIPCSAEGRILFKGPYSGADILRIKQEIWALSCGEEEVDFLPVVHDCWEIADSEYNDDFVREYALVFAAGASGMNGLELLNALEMRSLPIYACVSSNMTEEAQAQFREFSRVSGGAASVIGDDEQYTKLLSCINNITLLTFKMKSEVAGGSFQQLSVSFGAVDVQPVNISIRKSVAPSTPAPTNTPEPTATPVTEESEKQGLFGGDWNGIPLGMVFALVIFLLITIVLLVLLLTRTSAQRTEIYIKPENRSLTKKALRASARVPAGQVVPAGPREFTIKLRIVTIHRDAYTKEIRIAPNVSVFVGRNSECDISVEDGKLSRKHFSVLNSGSELVVQDMESTNGTVYNGKKLNGMATLKQDDYILVGMTKITVMSIR